MFIFLKTKIYLKRLIFISLLTLPFLISIFGCKREIGSPSWETNILAPLIETSIDLNDLLADSLMQVNGDGSVSVVVEKDLYTFDINEVMDIPAEISNSGFPFPGSYTIGSSGPFFTKTEEKKYNFGDASVSRIKIKKGKMYFKAQNTTNGNIICNYNFISVSKDGNQLIFNETIPAHTTGSNYLEREYDISGYTINLISTSNKNNTLTYKVQLSLEPGSPGLPVTIYDTLRWMISFKDLAIESAYGFFGSESFIIGPDSSSLDVFTNFSSGTFDLENVNASLDIQNYLGIDARLRINELSSLNSKTGKKINLNGTFLNKNLNINRATESGDPNSPVNPVVYHFPLGSDNMTEIIENMPDKIFYSMDIKTNPLGNITSGNDFLYGDYPLKASFNMEIPMKMSMQDLTFEEYATYSFKMGETNRIQDGYFYLYAENSFPFSINMQVYILNSDSAVIDSLFPLPNMVLAGYVDNTGKVLEQRRSEFKIYADEARMARITASGLMLIRATFNSAFGNQKVHIYNDNKLKVKIVTDCRFLLQP